MTHKEIIDTVLHLLAWTTEDALADKKKMEQEGSQFWAGYAAGRLNTAQIIAREIKDMMEGAL